MAILRPALIFAGLCLLPDLDPQASSGVVVARWGQRQIRIDGFHEVEQVSQGVGSKRIRFADEDLFAVDLAGALVVEPPG